MSECPGTGIVAGAVLVASSLTSLWLLGRFRTYFMKQKLRDAFEWLSRSVPSWLVTLAWVFSLGLAIWVWNANRLSEAEYDLVIDWLSCEECDAALADSIASQIGCRAVPVFQEFLYGLPEEEEQNVARRMTAQWNDIQPTGIDSVDFIQHYVSNMGRAAQLRAAVSLGKLGEWSILQMAFFEAEYLGFSPDVTSTLQYLVVERPSDDPPRRTSSVGGSVVDSIEGSGIAGLSVTLTQCGFAPPARTPPQAGRCWNLGPEGSASGVTDNAGRFFFSGRRPGVYQLDITRLPAGLRWSLPAGPPLLIQLLAPDDHATVDLFVVFEGG